jgi:hypothetical protein
MRRSAAAIGGLVLAVAACASRGGTTAGSAADAGLEASVDAGGDAAPPPSCNGHPELCARTFDQVAFPCTHNAYSAAEYGFEVPYQNQTSGLAKQLADGVRCMMLDVYDDGGARALCHVACALAKKSHLEALASIKAFLDAHPREVLTLDYEDYVPATDILADLTTAGLAPLLFDLDLTKGWPTLGAMIDANKRLVVGVEGHTTASSPPSGIYEFYSLAWDTPYTFTQPADFSCALNRGDPKNPLFLVNHWLSTNDLPDKTKAPVANAYDTLYGRAKSCAAGAKDFPNFVAVDFYEVGDLMRAIDTLNGF